MIIPTLASRSTTATPTFTNTTNTTTTTSYATPSTAAAPTTTNDNNNNTRTLIITTAVLGGALLLLVLAIVMFFLCRRRRRQKATQQHYQEARARDPTLTWDDYHRRQKLTHSRLFLEEELQRDMMIRKSLQSRTSVNTAGVVPAARPPLPPSALSKKPRRMRSRSWHAGQTMSHDEPAPQRPLPSADPASPSSSASPEMLEEHREGFRQEWRDIEASLEQTWEILTGKRHPSLDDARAPLIRGSPGGGVPHGAGAAADDTASSFAPSRPPTVRLKTPPLFRIHPAFRRASKHASLPAQFQPPVGGGGVVS